jgi:hypothetical protein
VTKYLRQLKEGKVNFSSRFQRFLPKNTWSRGCGPVVRQNIVSGSKWHRKAAHLIVSGERERERERETDKGARDKLPFQDMPPVTYSLCQIPPPKVSATSQLSIKLWIHEWMDPLMRSWSSGPRHLPKAPPLNTAALEIKSSTQELVGDISDPNLNTKGDWKWAHPCENWVIFDACWTRHSAHCTSDPSCILWEFSTELGFQPWLLMVSVSLLHNRVLQDNYCYFSLADILAR